MYRVQFDEQARQELNRRAHQPGIAPTTRDRLERLRLSDAGWSIPQIAKHLHRHEQTVRHWIKGVRILDFESEEIIASNRVVPDLPVSLIEQVLKQRKITYDLYRTIKQQSLSLSLGGARIRADKTQTVASELSRTVTQSGRGDNERLMGYANVFNSYVWINTHHTVRLYDSRAETDGSLRRGSYVLTSPNQMYLSTTGYNPYRKALGTPHMLEINARIEQPNGMPDARPDMRALATQILSLTKLNWASTDSLCAEPITIKYASDIAYLTAAFMRQAPAFRLHSVLEKTPWFL